MLQDIFYHNYMLVFSKCTMDVLQEKHMQLYSEQQIYKHNLVNYNMCKGHIPLGIILIILPVFHKILFGNVC